MPPHIACDRHSPPHSAQPCSTGGKTHALRLITWPPTTAFTTTAASLPLTHCPCCRHHRKPQPFRPRPCSCTCCRVLLGVCTVTMCADVCVHKLDQWRSSDSSTDISITLLDFKEGHTTLLAHALHWAPSAPRSETWSVGCLLLFDLEAGSRDRLHDMSPIVNNSIAHEDADQCRHETASRWCARS